MMLGIDKKANTETGLVTDAGERKQRAILALWDGAALVDDRCARMIVLWAIQYLAEVVP